MLLLIAELALVATGFVAAQRTLAQPWRTRVVFALKAYLTLRVLSLILLHEVDGVTLYAVLGEQLRGLDPWAFALFCFAAMAIKLVGIAASMTRWILMLRAQGIALPVRHIVGAFLIGRFLGTFLPSTLGLDGYKLYDASRFSGRTVEVSAATAVEKLLGGSAIFGTFLIALPLGIAGSDFREYAALIVGLGVPIALTPLAIVVVALFWPGPALIRWVLERVPLPSLRGTLARIADGATAYSGRRGLLLGAWGLSLVQHFTTAAMYVFTARALGVTAEQAPFWPVTFASSIQIFATVVSPFTIAGEGVRELAQGLLLQNQMTFALAAASGLLGFLAAEMPTLLGIIPWLLRGESYRPAYSRVDGAQVDYEAARRAAVDLGARAPAPEAAADIDPTSRRLLTGGRLGLAAGLWSGLAIGAAEAGYLLWSGKLVEDAQVLWAGPLAYALLFGGLGLAGGVAIGLLPFPRAILARWTPPLGLVGCIVPWGAIASAFLLYRDVFGEHLPPPAAIAAVVAGAVFAAAGLLAFGWFVRGTRARALLDVPTAVIAVTLTLIAGASIGVPVGAPAVTGLSRSVPSALERAPNVLLIIVDTLRADVLPAYGGREIQTPALDRLAAEGTVYRAAFAQASWTKPSIATILTSLYPSSHGAIAKPSRLPDSVETLAEAFSAHGYRTGGIVTNINLSPSFNFQQGFESYEYLAPDYLFGARDSSSRLLLYEIARRVAGRLSGGVRPGSAYQPGEQVNRAASRWLDEFGDERFFLLLHYMEPHDPYFTHPDDGRALARSLVPEPEASRRDDAFARYLGEVEHFDGLLAHLIGELERRGLYDELLIAVTADHGEEFLDHGGWWHGRTLYDEQIGVPLVVRWPAGARLAPARWTGQVRSLDVMPTLLRAAGAPLPPGLQGESLLGGPDRERTVFAEEDHEGNVLEAIRVGGWKAIRANDGNPRGLAPLELYHVARDPTEARDLAPDAAHADRARRVEAELSAAARAARAAQRAPEQVEIDPRECERLKALGYVQECGG